MSEERKRGAKVSASNQISQSLQLNPHTHPRIIQIRSPRYRKR